MRKLLSPQAREPGSRGALSNTSNLHSAGIAGWPRLPPLCTAMPRDGRRGDAQIFGVAGVDKFGRADPISPSRSYSLDLYKANWGRSPLAEPTRRADGPRPADRTGWLGSDDRRVASSASVGYVDTVSQMIGSAPSDRRGLCRAARSTSVIRLGKPRPKCLGFSCPALSSEVRRHPFERSNLCARASRRRIGCQSGQLCAPRAQLYPTPDSGRYDGQIATFGH
jgi:hypothetical protein